jgi:hypothetical protein
MHRRPRRHRTTNERDAGCDDRRVPDASSRIRPALDGDRLALAAIFAAVAEERPARELRAPGHDRHGSAAVTDTAESAESRNTRVGASPPVANDRRPDREIARVDDR